MMILGDEIETCKQLILWEAFKLHESFIFYLYLDIGHWKLYNKIPVQIDKNDQVINLDSLELLSAIIILIVKSCLHN